MAFLFALGFAMLVLLAGHWDGVAFVVALFVGLGTPPNPTGQMNDFGAVTTMCVISFPAGTDAPAHNAPQPYVCIILSGEGEVVTSDGQSRRFHPGEVLFCNDLTGKGHVTRAITDLVLAFINRAKS